MGTLSVSCPSRRVAAITVTLTNPSDVPLRLAALYGSAALVGPAWLPAPPGECVSLTFYYAPLLPGCEDTTLRLVSEEVRHSLSALDIYTCSCSEAL